MIRPEAPPPTFCPPTLSSTEHHEPLDRAPEELAQDDQWIADFIMRLSCAVDDLGRKKH